MPTLPALPDKVLALLPRLASDADGEVLATARLILRQLSAAETDWHDLVSRLKASSISREESMSSAWRDVAHWCAEHGETLSEKERSFVRDMANRLILGAKPTEKQAAWLRAIFAKLKEANRERPY